VTRGGDSDTRGNIAHVVVECVDVESLARRLAASAQVDGEGRQSRGDELFGRPVVVAAVIHVPALRQRPEDIPILVEYFVKQFAEKMAKRIRQIEKRTLELCERYSWPGNIRELQNIVERSVILCSSETFSIDEAWLSSQSPLRSDGPSPLPGALQDQEKEMIEAALAKSRGKVAGPRGAAATLGIPPSTLESKIKQSKIEKGRFSNVP
jgi:DNA-binding NtrC family response regulator